MKNIFHPVPFDTFFLQIDEPGDIVSDSILITPSTSPPLNVAYTRSPTIITPELRQSKPNSKLDYNKIFSFEFENDDSLLDFGGGDSMLGGPVVPESRPTTACIYQKTFSFNSELSEKNNLFGSGARNSVPNCEIVNENENADEYSEDNCDEIINENDMEFILNEINDIDVMHKEEIRKLESKINQLNISNNILNSNIKTQYEQNHECENIIDKYAQIVKYFNRKYNENICIDNFEKTVKLANENRNSLIQMGVQNCEEPALKILEMDDNTEQTSSIDDISDIEEEKYSNDSDKDECVIGEEQEPDVVFDEAVIEQDALIFVSDYNIQKEELHHEMNIKSIDDPFEWSIHSVCKWLKQNGLKKYRRQFKQERINGEALIIHLTYENLVGDIGMELNEAKYIFDLLQELRSKSLKYFDFLIDSERGNKQYHDDSEEYETDSFIDQEDQYEFELLGGNIGN